MSHNINEENLKRYVVGDAGETEMETNMCCPRCGHIHTDMHLEVSVSEEDGDVVDMVCENCGASLTVSCHKTIEYVAALDSDPPDYEERDPYDRKAG